MAAALVVTREQILGFRLRSHNLARRLPAGAFAAAAAVCGVQNSPPGSALPALHARVKDVTKEALARELDQRALVQVWSVRAAPLLVPTADAAVFTTGLLPQNEAELRFFISGAGDHLDRLGLTATELVHRTTAALYAVLDGRELTKDELGVALSRQLEASIPADLRDLWNSPDYWGHTGESLARFALNAVTLSGAFCVLSHAGRAATFVRTDQWLGRPFAPMDGNQAAAALLRRYLHAYGPSTAADFARWAGIAPAQARRMWQLVAPELAAVRLGSKTLWLLAADLPALAAGEMPQGVRLLPPHDSYLAARDRMLLLPDKRLHAQVWRLSGSPGVVLLDGNIAAAWRAQAKGNKLQVSVLPLTDLAQLERAAVETEVEALAPLRGCRGAAVAWTEL